MHLTSILMPVKRWGGIREQLILPILDMCCKVSPFHSTGNKGNLR